MEMQLKLILSLVFNLILFTAAVTGAVILIKKRKVETHDETVIPDAYLMDLDGAIDNKMFPITKSVITVGRSDKADLFIDGTTVSSTHSQISYRNHTFYLVDMGSTNGTYLNGNGERLNGEVILRSGDIVGFDKHKFKFVIRSQNGPRHVESNRAKIQKPLVRVPTDEKDALEIIEMTDKTDPDMVVPRAHLIDLSGVTGKDRFEISKKITKIGRSKGSDVDICISKNTISALQAQIEYRNGGFYLSDLGSTNGTYINEERQRITSKVLLKGNDIMYFDTFKFKFSPMEKNDGNTEQ